MTARAAMVAAAGLATVVAASACVEEVPPAADGGICPIEDVYVAESCDETFCGAVEVEVGTGNAGFVALDAGDEVDVVWGSQGGYHVDMAADMRNLCSIVYLRMTAWIDLGDGELVEILERERHVEALRVESEGSRQQYWGLRAFVPCEHWPDDPARNPSCAAGAGSAGPIGDFEVVLGIEAEDHDGRLGYDERRVQPVCCRN